MMYEVLNIVPTMHDATAGRAVPAWQLLSLSDSADAVFGYSEGVWGDRQKLLFARLVEALQGRGTTHDKPYSLQPFFKLGLLL